MIEQNQFPSADKLNRLLPGYQVENLIESEGATALYRGMQESLQRRVDIKVLPALAQVPEIFKRRFMREAHAMAQLSHPHVVNVYDHGEVPGVCQFIVFEENRGQSLRSLLHSPLDPEEALRILSDVAEAVAYTHERGMIHLNIKPDHIFVGSEGRAKLKDFNMAKMEGGETVLTRVSDFKDRIDEGHFAPEHQSDHEPDHRADVYSMGVLFYEMLTARFPQATFAPPSQFVPVSGKVDRVVLRCMHQNPHKRFDSMQALLAEVHALLQKPEDLVSERSPFYARLVPKTVWFLLVVFLVTLGIMLIK